MTLDESRNAIHAALQAYDAAARISEIDRYNLANALIGLITAADANDNAAHQFGMAADNLRTANPATFDEHGAYNLARDALIKAGKDYRAARNRALFQWEIATGRRDRDTGAAIGEVAE